MSEFPPTTARKLAYGWRFIIRESAALALPRHRLQRLDYEGAWQWLPVFHCIYLIHATALFRDKTDRRTILHFISGMLLAEIGRVFRVPVDLCDRRKESTRAGKTTARVNTPPPPDG